MELEAQLESKIINQLAHKIGPEKLKDSSIRMKKTPNWVSVTLWSVFIFILISCTLYLKSYVVITKIVSKDEVLNIIKNIMTTSRLFVAVVCAEAVCVFVTIWYIVNAQIKHRFFRKVCIKDNEIELFEEEGKESYFDKYMDEIKYMLCKAEEDIIVFEDIDRYDSRLIFQKLREINMICNHNTKKIIRFIYLIRDDMFEQKDRTKFFDFIIPILPVVNCANSYEIFMTLFEGTELEKERRFFKQLSLYVDEMRLVNNIYNEFLIYEKNLRKISVGKTKKKIFALVVYKNIFPSDYILLQNNRGFIAEVFHVKEQCVNSRVKLIDEQIRQIDKKVVEEKQEFEKEYLENENEVKAMYFPISEIYYYNNKTEADYPDRIAFVTDIINNANEVKVRDNNRYSYSYSFLDAADSVNKAIKRMEQNLEYQKHLEKVLKKKEWWKGKEHFYIEQIKELQEEKREISRFTVQQFIRKYGYEELYTKIQEVNKTLFEKIDASDYKGVIQFFLATGAIDESYGDLVAVFHGKDVKQGDKRYIRAVLDGVEIPYDYEIENATAILESLSADELRRENTLNFKLFAYIMVNGDEQLQNAMVDAIVQNRVYEFIQKFSEKSLIKRKKWVPNIAEKNPQFIGDCLHCMHTIEGLDLFVAAAILYSDSRKVLTKIEWLEEEFEVYFREDTLYENVMREDGLTEDERKEAIQNMVKFYEFFHIKNENFHIKMHAQSEIFDAIYENNLYQINKNMLNLVLQKKYGLNPDDIGYLNSLSEADAIEGKVSAVHAYVEENIDDFMEMIKQQNIVFIDSSEHLSKLIQMADITWTELICDHMQNTVENLECITSIDKVNLLIKKKKLAFLTKNIVEYYMMWCEVTEPEKEDMLISYMNDFPTQQIALKDSERKQLQNKGDERSNSLFLKIAKDEMLSDEKYKSFLLSLCRIWCTGLDNTLPNTRVSLLISAGIIKMTKETLEVMRKAYPRHVSYFIQCNAKKYVEKVITEDNFDLDECLCVLECDISDDIKISLLSFTDEAVSVQNDKYSEKLISYLLEHNYDKEDEDYLLENEYQMQEIQNFREQLALDDIKGIIGGHKRMSLKLFLTVIENNTLQLTENEYKILLADHLELLSEEQLVIIFRKHKWIGYLKIMNGKNPLISVTSTNKLLLDRMKQRGYISSYKDDKNEEYYRVFAKRRRKG